MEKQKTKFKWRLPAVAFFLIAALFLIPVSGYSVETLDEQVAAAVAGGQQYLFNNFHDNGDDTGYYFDSDDSGYYENFPLANTAAAVAALIETGKYSDPAYSAQIDKAVAYIKAQKKEDGSIHSNNNMTYETGMALVALSLYHTVNPQEGEFITDYIQPAVDYFIYGDFTYGGWRYEACCLKDDEECSDCNYDGADLSTTQFAVMGLWYAYHYVLNQDIPTDVKDSVVGFVRRTQQTNGVFSYMSSGGEAGAPMNGAGLWTLAMLGIDKTDQDVQESLDWFNDNYTWQYTAGYGNKRAYYYAIYAMSKGLTALIPSDYQFAAAANPWVTDLKQALWDSKIAPEEDGVPIEGGGYYWYDGTYPGRTISTSWVIMSLSFADPGTESTKKVLPDTAEPDYPIQKKGFVTLEATDGVTISDAIHGNNGRADAGESVRLPIGSFDFTLNNVPEGGEAVLKIIPPRDALDPNNPDSFINADGTLKDGLRWFKIRNGEWRGQSDVPIRLMPEGGPYTYIEVTLTDGGPEDEDGDANGQIQDPAAPGYGGEEEVPTGHNNNFCFISSIALW